MFNESIASLPSCFDAPEEQADIFRLQPRLSELGVDDQDSHIIEHIESCLFRYLPDVCEQKIDRKEGRFHRFANRIWKCWFFHWLESNPAEPDGFKVFQTIEQGKSYPLQNDLDGNPIHDVTLAEAMGQSENKAWERFERQHKNDLSERVERIEAVEDWWNDFLTYLGGYGVNGRSSQKIAKYEGKVGLRRWLSVVVYNRLVP